MSVTYFWAEWAAPCKEMNEEVKKLASKHDKILFLQVDADTLPDISESFEIESVPAFIGLRGHTLLGRVIGANVDELNKLVDKHSAAASKPLSTSEKAPAAAPTAAPVTAPAASTAAEEKEEAKKEETTEELNARMKKIMDSDKVVLFMKGSPDTPRCGFSRQIVAILKENDIKFTHFDILQDEAVRQGLKTYNNWPTFPQLIIGGELVGGLDIVKEMVSNDELKEALENADAA